jgi:predicted RNase H-like nuclease (RuvC/YqgF family)
MKIQEIQTRNRPEAADTIIAREETRKLRSAVSDQRREIANIKARNGELEARINEIQELLSTEQKDGMAMIGEKDQEINELRNRQNELLRDYDELTKMKTSLENEIDTYRRLLEGDDKKEGLKQVVEGIEERARQNLMNPQAALPGSTSYSFSIQTQSGGNRSGVYSSTDSGKYGGGSSKLKFIY